MTGDAMTRRAAIEPPRPTQPGRPTKWTPERRARLLKALTAGNTRRAACAHAGISEDTFARLLKRDAGFADAIKKAEAAAELRNVSIIQRAARTTWQAAAWWLERKFPDTWARRDRVPHGGPDGGPIPMTLEEAMQVGAARRMAAARELRVLPPPDGSGR